jgi:hypothetical protein
MDYRRTIRYDRRVFEVRDLTPARVRMAYGIAAFTDIAQVLMGPAGWALADEILDVAAMLLISRLIGFHALLLPTFVLELVPLADLLPTWTAAVALVVALRRQRRNIPPPDERNVIDV